MFLKVSISTFLIAAFCTNFQVGDCEKTEPMVETPLGKLRGYQKTSHGGRIFSAFVGVPYAKPPIGWRRFEAPEEIDPWIGVWQARFFHECAHVITKGTGNVFSFADIPEEQTEITGQEDCLYLNVYVPRDNPNPHESLDVIVHIHGGAYMFGNGHVYAHPEYLMDKDLIFVTFNYRLGVLGFLSTEDDILPGNNGLKDQVMALKWVQQNIASFGGNPDSVTLSGMSSSASSSHLHYFSPMSKGLFHRGMSQSGCALTGWSLQKGALAKAKFLASAVGCPDSSSDILLICLKRRHYRQILNKVYLLYGYKFEPTALLAPVVEKGTKPFLEDEPYKLLTRKKVQRLPWLVSTVSQEGIFLTNLAFGNNIAAINAEWEKSAPFSLYYYHTIPPSRWKEISKKIKDEYLGKDQEVTKDNFEDFAQIYTDRMYYYPAVEAAKLQAKIAPVYYYYFNYPGDHSTIVKHTDDNQYLFSGNTIDGIPTPNELKMKDVLLEMVTSYAKTGKPTIDGVTWEPTKSDQLTFLNISGFRKEDLKFEKLQHLKHEEFWKSLGL